MPALSDSTLHLHFGFITLWLRFILCIFNFGAAQFCGFVNIHLLEDNFVRNANIFEWISFSSLNILKIETVAIILALDFLYTPNLSFHVILSIVDEWFLTCNRLGVLFLVFFCEKRKSLAKIHKNWVKMKWQPCARPLSSQCNETDWKIDKRINRSRRVRSARMRDPMCIERIYCTLHPIGKWYRCGLSVWRGPWLYFIVR